MYVFDKVLKPTVTQEYVYESVAKPIVKGMCTFIILLNFFCSLVNVRKHSYNMNITFILPHSCIVDKYK